MQNRSQAPPTFSFALLYLHNVVWILLLLPYSNAKLKKKPELVEVITLLEKKCKNKYSSVFSSFFLILMIRIAQVKSAWHKSTYILLAY